MRPRLAALLAAAAIAAGCVGTETSAWPGHFEAKGAVPSSPIRAEFVNMAPGAVATFTAEGNGTLLLQAFGTFRGPASFEHEFHGPTDRLEWPDLGAGRWPLRLEFRGAMGTFRFTLDSAS